MMLRPDELEQIRKVADKHGAILSSFMRLLILTHPTIQNK
jgi:hypothetical protein